MEMFVSKFEVLSWNLPRGIEKKKPYSLYSAFTAVIRWETSVVLPK